MFVSDIPGLGVQDKRWQWQCVLVRKQEPGGLGSQGCAGTVGGTGPTTVPGLGEGSVSGQGARPCQSLSLTQSQPRVAFSAWPRGDFPDRDGKDQTLATRFGTPDRERSRSTPSHTDLNGFPRTFTCLMTGAKEPGFWNLSGLVSQSSGPLSSALDAALPPSKSPRKAESHQATKGSHPVPAPHVSSFSLSARPSFAPVLPGPRAMIPPALPCCSPLTCLHYSGALVSIPRSWQVPEEPCGCL